MQAFRQMAFSVILMPDLTDAHSDWHLTSMGLYPMFVQTVEMEPILTRNTVLIRKCIAKGGQWRGRTLGWMLSKQSSLDSTPRFPAGRHGTIWHLSLFFLKNFTNHNSLNDFNTFIFMFKDSAMKVYVQIVEVQPICCKYKTKNWLSYFFNMNQIKIKSNCYFITNSFRLFISCHNRVFFRLVLLLEEGVQRAMQPMRGTKAGKKERFR